MFGYTNHTNMIFLTLLFFDGILHAQISNKIEVCNVNLLTIYIETSTSHLFILLESSHISIDHKEEDIVFSLLRFILFLNPCIDKVFQVIGHVR